MATIKDGKGTLALCAFDSSAELKKHEFGRPSVGSNDVAIDIKFCGMCHSDLHACNGDWGLNMFPIAPGHEVAGIVTAVGSDVANVKVGDRVGVGCMVNSCNSCSLCKGGHENHCTGMIQTYGSVFPDTKSDACKDCTGNHTNGGYSSKITVLEKFVFHIPESMEMEYAAPLLCAGITTFSPLNRHILQKGGGAGKHVAVVGFGGLGHVAVKIAKAMGADVTVLSRSKSKEKEAAALGAEILAYTDEEAVNAAARKFDLILDTVSAEHPIGPLASTVNVYGTYVLLGAVGTPFPISAMQLIFNHVAIEGSLIGGVPETQEMLEFCAKHNIVPDIKIIHAKDANAQFKALADGTADAKRAVIDMSTISDL